MIHHGLIATIAAGTAFAGQSLPPPSRPLSLDAAMEIARHEIVRRGLAATHCVSAFYAGVDRHAEGAAFAAIVRPNSAGRQAGRRPAAQPRLKLLIHEDGGTSLQPLLPRITSPA